MPNTATFSVGWTWATLIALYVVTPAQVSGAASREVDPVGDRHDVVGVRDGVLGEGAVDRVAAVLLLLAERLPAADAVAALAARVAEPGDRDAVADRAVRDAFAELARRCRRPRDRGRTAGSA